MHLRGSPKWLKKIPKAKPITIPKRLRDMCKRYAIRCAETHRPPWSSPEPNVSSKSSQEAPWRTLKTHLCDYFTVWGAPMGTVLRSWVCPFSVIFFDAFPRRAVDELICRVAGSAAARLGKGIPCPEHPRSEFRMVSSTTRHAQAFGLAWRIGAPRQACHRTLGSCLYDKPKCFHMSAGLERDRAQFFSSIGERS